MTAARHVPRVALRVGEAAESLGLSEDAFREYVQPHVRIVRLGRAKLIGLSELERFVDEHGERILEGIA